MLLYTDTKKWCPCTFFHPNHTLNISAPNSLVFDLWTLPSTKCIHPPDIYSFYLLFWDVPCKLWRTLCGPIKADQQFLRPTRLTLVILPRSESLKYSLPLFWSSVWICLHCVNMAKLIELLRFDWLTIYLHNEQLKLCTLWISCFSTDITDHGERSKWRTMSLSA